MIRWKEPTMEVPRSSNLLWQELKSKAQRAFREQLVTYENLLHTTKQLTADNPTDFSLNFAPASTTTITG
ncbi:hypothetical protein [Caproiciproducens galactitolivorans]|uniref:Uncharacterized protein n=1 Tax=Caproiciproducens galactitolivorans TaxID=642589 RepID=A0ABT4BS22_9FIRM|nr:hypothetical protein [Caproiciproducens galactitolivorans]MCY1712898.1 hypothetical protein [Caproiciproducens galactitolivorans]